MNGEGLLSMGFQYLSCIKHTQLSKAANMIECILVPRGRDPCGQRHGLRPLAGTEAGSPRITDFRLLCTGSEI